MSAQNLFEPPATPHALDDEFEAAEISGDWTEQATWSETEIDAFENFDDAPRYSLGLRASWITFQPHVNGKAYLQKSLGTVPTNLLVWCRWRAILPNSLSPTSVQDEGSAHLYLGGISDDDHVFISAQTWSGARRIRCRRENNNVGDDLAYSADYDRAGMPLHYMAIHKLGSVFHYWAGDGASWYHLAEYDHSRAENITKVALLAWGNDGAATDIFAGRPLVGFDFVRFLETDQFPL